MPEQTQDNTLQAAMAKGDEKLVKLRPTLFIGVGGTGMEVLMRVRRRILNAPWGADSNRVDSLTDFPVAEFIQLDLDHGAVIDTGRAQNEDLQFDLVKFSDDEKLVESFDVEKYCRDDDSLNRFPHIQSWFPLQPKKIRDLGIDPSKGAGQIRAISRLYFFDKYTRIRDKIRGKLHTLRAGLSTETQQRRLGLDMDTQKYRIVVVGSVAGGTGSGAFLDMGWLAGWIAREVVSDADVELALFMPTGYAGANKDRTEANGYAALMELESSMIGDANLVTRWDAYDKPQLSQKPYHEVYLVDSGNLAGQNTKEMSDVYHMVADVLFEDFASADFANKKRSVAVNQRQHKISPFSPALPANRFGDMKLNYSRTYSAFGQSVLDTLLDARREEQAHRLAVAMLKAFFGVAGGDVSASRATEKQRDDFMAAHLSLAPSAFSDFPDFSSKDVKLGQSNGEFREYRIVEDLIRDRDGSLVDNLQQRISARMDDIRNGFSRDQWAVQIREAVSQFEREVISGPGAGTGKTEARVQLRRREKFEQICRETREQLFTFLDNKAHGGLEYVLSLVEQIKDRLENPDTGLIKALETNASRYEELRDAVRTHEYERLMSNLEQTRGGIFGSLFNNSEQQAATVTDHLNTEIGNGLKFHLRAKAAREAALLMGEVSRWLGESQGVDAAGKTIWSGLVGELQSGRQAVLGMIERLERDITILRQDINRDHATLIVIDTPEKTRPLPAAQVLREWADEAFKDFGGSATLFPLLAQPEQRPALLRKVIRMAEKQMAGTDSADQPEADPLFAALERMSPDERKRKFEDMLKRAMPWINANLDRDFVPKADQFKCFIGVAGADEFKKKFRAEIDAAVPAGFGMTAAQIDIVETGEPGRAVCYAEVSGLPLTVMRGLEAWRTSYRKEGENIPLHTHIDMTRFPHPVAPGNQELHELADDFKLYLQAVMLGIVTRYPRPLTPAGQYQFEVAPGDNRRIGNERAFRLNGLPMAFREQIQARVEDELSRLDGSACGALSILAAYYADTIYAPRLLADETGAQQARIGFACAMAKELEQELRSRALRKGCTEAALEQAAPALRKSIGEWTEAVPESDADAYPTEVREADNQPRLKQVMRSNATAQTIVKQAFGAAPAAGGFAGTPMPPPPPQDHQYHLSVNGQPSGPFPAGEVVRMMTSGQVDASRTHVWRNGFAGWMLLSQCPELQTAAGSMPPPPPPPLP